MSHSTYSDALRSLRHSLASIYDAGEAAAVAKEMMREATGIDYAKSLASNHGELSNIQQGKIDVLKEKILAGMPLQYAVGHAQFLGREFFVDASVLIPRPETEELVALILEECSRKSGLKILDVGTGSGCIPVSLKLALPDAKVYAVDYSDAAITTASKNAAAYGAAVSFIRMDFLNERQRDELGLFELIVSNPPYIPLREEQSLSAGVKDWEPRLALFVDDDDPLIFYRAIAGFGKKHLLKNGIIYCELHADFGAATLRLFIENGYDKVKLLKDISGNDRMLRASF